MDVWGPSPTESIRGNKYYLSIIDDFSKFIWLFPLNAKSQVAHTFINFQTQIERYFDCKIKSVQTDFGGEFQALKSHLLTTGIIHRLSCPHTHEQNGSVERRHRHIVETGLTLMANASVPHQYWDDAFLTATYLINRLLSPVIHHKTPLELLFKQTPDYTLLRTFGCACWPYLRPYNSHKMDYRSALCVFLGYSPLHRGYQCLQQSTGRVFISRHVIFDESHFPFQQNHPPSPAPPNPSPTLPSSLCISQPNTMPTTLSLPQTQLALNLSNGQNNPLENTPPATTFEQPNSHPMITRSKNNIHRPKNVPPDMAPTPRALLTEIHSIEPTSFTAASKSPHWRQAMNEEFQALLDSGTWILVPLKPNTNLVGCKWVYRIKKRADGTIERYKARLVAKGFHQLPGIDYDDTFSPVVKPTTIRTVISFAVSQNWPIRQLDIKNAFLHGTLQETVYMTQPPGFSDPSCPKYVCHLQKSLYGLKQAPRAWFSKLSNKLVSMGFSASKADTSLFIFKSPQAVIYFLIYVDDIIITGPNKSLLHSVISNLQQDFPLKDLGNLHYFLGVEALLDDRGLFLSQQKYIFDLLKKTDMINAKPVNSPMSPSANLSLFKGDPFHDPTLYRSTVGSLQYLSFTRPDLAFAVSKVCQFMQRPTTDHWTAVKRILRYLRQTMHHGILIRRTSSTDIHAFSDADWAGCSDDRRSVSGYCVYLGSNLISWSSRKQPTVSRSSTEAEYRAVANTTAEVMWLRSLLTELGILSPTPPVLWCDNIGATYLTANPLYHSRTKHIELDIHFVRDQVAQRHLQVRFISSTDQIADSFTKALPTARFCSLRNNLNVHELPLRLRGRNGATESPAPDKAHARDKAQDKSQQMDKDQIQNNREEEEAHVQEITNSM